MERNSFLGLWHGLESVFAGCLMTRRPQRQIVKCVDRLYRRPRPVIRDFNFGERTSRVLDDMLSRSVPCYDEMQRMVVELVGDFARDGTSVYDLGCSTGTTLLHLVRTYGERTDVEFVGVDNSKAMLRRAREKLLGAGYGNRCTFRLADLHELVIENASVVMLILTFQFIRPPDRERLLRRV